VFLCAAAGISTAASAQQTFQQQDPTPTRDQVELPRPEERVSERARVRIDSRAAFQAAPCPLNEYDLKVSLQRVQFTGVGGGDLPPEITSILSRVTVPTNPDQPLRVVCDVRDAATAALRDAGYISSVQIPPQAIETGDLRLEVIVARIVDVRVRGEAPPYRETIGARIEQLKSLYPLNQRDAERILLLAGDVPGLDVQMQLRPAGTVPGEVIGELTLVYNPVNFLVNVQNLGSKQLGRETVYARAEAYGLLGTSDMTYVGGSTTLDFENQQVLQVGHVSGIGNSGATLGGEFLYAWSNPDIGALDLTSRSFIASLEAGVPLARTLRTRARLASGLEILEQRTRVSDVPLNRDKLRVAYVRGEYFHREPSPGADDLYSLRGALELRKGLDIFNATERGEVSSAGFTPSRFEGNPTAFVAKAEVDGVIGIGPIFSLAATAEGQWANDPLLNFEEYSIGNLTIGRGYDPGANSGDRVLGLRGEVRAAVHRFQRPGGGKVELFGFYDSVWIWNLDTGSIENDRRLGSWGGGLRGILPGLAIFEAIYARPEDKALLTPDARRAPDRLLLSLTMQFSPRRRP
jgi:hemolysin activation/secretion protein